MAAPDQTGGARVGPGVSGRALRATRSMKAGASISATSFAKVPARLNGGGASLEPRTQEIGRSQCPPHDSKTPRTVQSGQRDGVLPFRRGEVRSHVLVASRSPPSAARIVNRSVTASPSRCSPSPVLRGRPKCSLDRTQILSSLGVLDLEELGTRATWSPTLHRRRAAGPVGGSMRTGPNRAWAF